MIVSHSRRVLFVHVQKTGGQTVEAVLTERLDGAEKLKGLPGAKHARLGDALREHPELADYWTFGFVRNPWARMWSWYSMIERRREAAERGNTRMRTRIGRNKFWSGVLQEIPDFEAFVMNGPDHFPRMRVPQVDYLGTRTRRADFIGQTESFAADLSTVCAHLEIEAPPEVPRRNAGPRGDYREHYTPAMRQRVADVFAPDIEAFGYDFESGGANS